MNIITPIFPCRSLDELLEFYQALGFEIAYQQKSPNPYAVIKREWIRMDFYGVKHHDPKKCYHTCYILTDEVDDLYNAFREALKIKYGKVPTRGLPRISELRDKASGVREFMISDIAGTCIRIGKMLDKEAGPQYSDEVKAADKRLSLALDFAYKSEGEADEYEKVAKVLDAAIAREKQQPCLNLIRVMICRADIAIEQNLNALAKDLLKGIKENEYFRKNREHFKTEIQRMEDIENKL